MPRVVIHAGPGKTGTSAIQLWLNEHREELRAEGIYYPSHETDANGVSSGNLRRVLDRHVPGDIHVSPELVAELMTEFQGTGCHTLLLSSEFFFPVIPELDEAFPGAEFIAYLRDPLEMFESNYNQSVKRHGCHLQLRVPQKLPLGQIAVLTAFRQRRPELQVDVRPYLQELFVGGSLVSDLLAAIGSRLQAGPERRVNASYSPVGLEFKRLANRFPLGPLEHELDVLLQNVAPATEPYSLIDEAHYEAAAESVSLELVAWATELGLERVKDLPERLLARSKPRFAHQAASLDELNDLVVRMREESSDLVSRLCSLIEQHPLVETTNAAFFEALGLEARPVVAESELFARAAARDLAQRIHRNDQWQPADIAREIALFAERQGELQVASTVMAAALELRPGGHVIQHKHRKYREQLAGKGRE